MKKLFAAFLVFCVITVTAGSTLAQSASPATGLLKKVVYTSRDGSEIVDISLVNYTDYSIMRLSSPERIVIDIFQCSGAGEAAICAGGRGPL